MKNKVWRYIVLLTLACPFLLNAAAQGVGTWIETTHDFGTFKEEVKTVTCTMKMVNTGDSAMVITRVQSTCGCTVAEFTHEVIQPGDTGCVDITYSARNIPGQFEKKVFVYTSGRPRRTVLTVKGNVIGSPETVNDRYPVAVGPVRLNVGSLPLGEMYRGKPQNAYLSGYNTSSDTMLVTVEDVPGNISAHVLPDTVAPGGLFIISVYYDSAMAKEWGLNIDTLSVYATPLRKSSTAAMGAARINVMAHVKEDFSKWTDKQKRNAPVVEISTDKLDFEEVNPQEAVKRSFSVKNAGKSSLAIRRLFVPQGEGLTVTCDKEEISKGGEATVTVTFDGRSRGDRLLNSRLVVMTNDPYTPQVIVRLVGVLKK